MSNTVIFKDTKIWRNDIKTDNGEFSAYTTTISSKNQDESWDRAYLPIRFSKNADVPSRISNGTMADLEGFLTVKKRKDGRNEVQMMVMRCNIKSDISEVDSFELASEEIPFK